MEVAAVRVPVPALVARVPVREAEGRIFDFQLKMTDFFTSTK